jgi:histidine triad (HIT) family protein
MAGQQEITKEQAQALQEKVKNMSPEELAAFQRENCIFCKIVHHEIESKIVYEDEVCLVTLDILPAAKGHMLIIPKEHYLVMPQVPDQVLGHMFVISKRFSQILLKTFKVSGTNVFAANGQVAGQRSQHFFLHLIPRKEGDNVLNLHEKIIDKQMQSNVKISIEKKLFELMGVEPTASNDKVSDPDRSEKQTYDESNEKNENHESKATKLEDSMDVNKIKKSGSKPKKKSKSKKEPKRKESMVKVIDDEQEDGNANLDDIAGLFK